MSKKKFVGISKEDDILKIAQIHLVKGKIVVDKLDQITLHEEAKQNTDNGNDGIKDNNSDNFTEVSFDDMDTDSIFGIGDDGPSNGTTLVEPSSDFDSDSMVQEDTDVLTVESVKTDEKVNLGKQSQNNAMLVHNLLLSVNKSKAKYALNIPSGSTIFQIIKDQDHSKLKKKVLSSVIDDKLESIYGATKSSDHYGYEIRKDGALVLASNDNEIELLNLMDQSKDLFYDKVTINEILPDEVSLIGLIRNNYKLKEHEITGIVDLGQKTTRLIFLKGDQIWSVTPLINEGTQSKHVLSTIYSKILFQLDTGELPSLERIVIANNVLGNKAITFFKRNFLDIIVENLQFDKKNVEIAPELKKTYQDYTTAIGIAWAASGYKQAAFDGFSFLPTYIADRQKVFKLHWHGMLLLALIAMVPALFNYSYHQKIEKINNLKNQIRYTDNKIENVRPLVIGVQTISQKYNKINKQIARLQSLDKGTDTWAKTLNVMDKGMEKINSCWVTAMRSVKGGILIQGYSLYRNRIPQFTNLFSKAVLQNVQVDKMKGKKVYQFTVMVQKVYGNQVTID